MWNVVIADGNGTDETCEGEEEGVRGLGDIIVHDGDTV
jgi:hypothetical protein